MKLTVNGESQQLPDGATIAALLEKLGLKGRAVAVEVNKQVVPRREHDKAPLHDGDHVELVTLVGGG